MCGDHEPKVLPREQPSETFSSSIKVVATRLFPSPPVLLVHPGLCPRGSINETMHTDTSIYNRLAKRARSVHAALPRMHLLFNVLRALIFGASIPTSKPFFAHKETVVILAWSVIVLAIAIHFQLVLVSSELSESSLYSFS